MEELFTVEEVAERLKLSQKTIRRLIERGDLPAIRFDRVIRIKQADLEAFLEKRRLVTGEEQ